MGNISTSNEIHTNGVFFRYKDQTIVISPNLGFPKFLGSEEKILNSENKYHFFLNLIGPKETTIEGLKQKLDKNIWVKPLFEMNKNTNKLQRGNPILLDIQSIIRRNTLMLESESLKDLYSFRSDRQSYLLRHNFFGKDRDIFVVEVILDLKNSSDCLNWLKSHPFLMFDLIQSFPNLDKVSRICYHAVVARKKNWTSLEFAQITDIHVAQRYDEVLGVIAKHLDIHIERIDFERIKQILKLKFRFFKKKHWEEINQEVAFLKSDPLIRRFQNPNNKLRQFILMANQAALQEKLDFVFMTGDLIDFCRISSGEKSDVYDLEETNWDTFLRILLNDPIEYRPDCKPRNIVIGEELALPMFTITGNHDVRLNPYPITAVGYYSNFGMTLFEALFYKDLVKRSKMKALIIEKYSLTPYYQFFNPFDDYFLKFGENVFIALNSGSDSFLNIKSMIMANPASVGFKTTQINYTSYIAEKYIKKKMDSGFAFLISHAPILNPTFKSPILHKIYRFFHLNHKKRIDNFKESALLRHGKTNVDVADKLYFGYGNISNNVEKIMELMENYKMIGLMGHTHMFREFHYHYCGEKTRCDDLDIKKMKKKYSIFWDDYSILKPPVFFEENRPFILQTPSLGLRRLEDEKKFGAYRMIKIKGKKIEMNQVHYVSDYNDQAD